MIAKKFRLCESQVKKVLKKRKPFFSYGLVANVIPNTDGYGKFAVILSATQTRGSVNRNTLRRFIYDQSLLYSKGLSYDIVYTFPKKTFLDSQDPLLRSNLRRDISFLMKKISSSYTSGKK